MPYKAIMQIIPAMKATALATEAAKLPLKKGKITTKDMLKSSTKTIVGTSLLKIEADLIAGL